MRNFIGNNFELKKEVIKALELVNCGEEVSHNCPSACAQSSKDMYGHCFWEEDCWHGLRATLSELRTKPSARVILYASGYDEKGNIIYTDWQCGNCGYTDKIKCSWWFYSHIMEECPNCDAKLEWDWSER